MPVTFDILGARGLVVVRYSGHANIAETAEAFGRYAQHPQARPGQKQLIDLSGIASFETDFVALMKLQMRKAEVFLSGGGEQTLIVYFAPGEIACRMAELIVRSWEGIDGIVGLVQQSEAEALALLGQPERSLEALMAAAG